MDELMMLRAQLEGLQLQRDRIDAAIEATKAKIGQAPTFQTVLATGDPSSPLPVIPITGGRKPLSDEARKRIAAAQKRRWNKLKQEKKAAARG